MAISFLDAGLRPTDASDYTAYEGQCLGRGSKD